jgi:XTP/dITP diphosphohydrolase
MSVTKQLVLASNNRGKLAELARLLEPYRVVVHAQAQFIGVGADEIGTTFQENALRKAIHASRAAGLAAIGDDSGLEVDALHGAPGIFSARFAGDAATDKDNNEKLLHELQGVAVAHRVARFRCALAYVSRFNDPSPLLVESTWEGAILLAPRGSAGFGYDPLFLPHGSRMSCAELSMQEKNTVSHRAQALRLLLEQLLIRQEIDL